MVPGAILRRSASKRILRGATGVTSDLGAWLQVWDDSFVSRQFHEGSHLLGRTASLWSAPAAATRLYDTLLDCAPDTPYGLTGGSVGASDVETNDLDDTRAFHFTVFVDNHRVHLQDCRLAGELDQRYGEDPVEYVAWLDAHVASVLSSEAYTRQFGGAHGTLYLLTARDFTAPLTVQARADAPAAS
jgi:hypothetical protein